ncbi:MAG: SDR family oxidoreductase [Alphaproteobacteria bacterium]|jgi:nucleoside-diphosphate-sugar epimerase
MKEEVLFIFGLGYSSLELVNQLQKNVKFKNLQIVGTTTSLAKKAELEKQGLKVFLFNEQTNEIENKYLLEAKYILHSIPSRNEDVVVPYISLLEKNKNLVWFGYFSTTGVYGDYKGKWVDETSPTKPYNERTLVRIETEQSFLKAKLPTHIFRLAGIYGQGRNILEDLKLGVAKRIYKRGQVFSRIHAEDIARIIIASMQHPTKGEIFNVCDDLPASSKQVVEYASKLLKIKPPELIDYATAIKTGKLSSMAIEFYSANKRVRNDKIKKLLNIQLKYPNYKVGLIKLKQELS